LAKGRKGYAGIFVSREVFAELRRLKVDVGARTWDDLLKYILQKYKEYEDAEVRRRIIEVLCNDFSEAKGSLAAWGRILSRRLSTAREVTIALQLLARIEGTEDYVVDKSKCGK